MKHYLYMCFLALTLGTTVSCQQAEELTHTLAKDEITNCYTDCYTDDRLYNVDVYKETKTATINYVKDENATNVVIPASITYKNEVYTVNKLGNVYRTSNEKITSISLPNTIITLGELSGASIKEIDIPNSVVYIAEKIFYGCKELERIKCSSNITSIPYAAFEKCPKLQTIQLPERLEEIGHSAFAGCTALKSIILPESLTKMGDGYKSDIFYLCTSLTSINIPSKVTTIGMNTFNGCTKLQNVNLGAGVTVIREGAFNNCPNLKALTVCSSIPPTLEYNAISDDIYDNCTLYVPEGSIETYRKDTQWGKFANIKVSGESPTPDEPKASLTDTESTIPEGTYEAGKLTYSRTNEKFAEGKYVTICLPFSINLADADCFSAVYIPKDIALYNPTTKMLTLMMKKSSKTAILPAGQPFMAKLSGNTIALKNYSRTYITSTYADDLKANMETKIEVYNYDGSSSVMESNDDIDVRFCGTFSKKEDLDKENYRTFTPDGSFAQDTQVSPFRAYIYKATTSTSPTLQSLSITTGGVADDILNGNYTIKGNKLIINK